MAITMNLLLDAGRDFLRDKTTEKKDRQRCVSYIDIMYTRTGNYEDMKSRIVIDIKIKE